MEYEKLFKRAADIKNVDKFVVHIRHLLKIELYIDKAYIVECRQDCYGIEYEKSRVMVRLSLALKEKYSEHLARVIKTAKVKSG